MNRRTLFGRFAAIAAAATLAPTVKVEAAPMLPTITFTPTGDNGYYRASDGLWHVVKDGVDYGALRPDVVFSDAIDEARAEAYERGRAIEQAKVESRAFDWDAYIKAPKYEAWSPAATPLTFEEMQADCAARGCKLGRHVSTADGLAVTHESYPVAGDAVTARRFIRAEDVNFQAFPGMDAGELARVDAWRRSIHEPEVLTLNGSGGFAYPHMDPLT